MLDQPLQRYVQKKEAARYLGIGVSTFDKWRNSKNLRYYKPGAPKNHNPNGRCLFWLPDVLNWVAPRPH